MKTLWIVRHAKAEAASQGLRDFDRPLSERGRHDLSVIAGRLLKKGFPLPRQLVFSPALRTRETAELIAEKLGLPDSVLKEDRQIYLAGESRLLQLLCQLDGAPDCVMLVGHNPAITDLLNILCDNVRIDHVPAGGVACLTFSAAGWSALQPGAAVLESFDYPGAYV